MGRITNKDFNFPDSLKTKIKIRRYFYLFLFILLAIDLAGFFIFKREIHFVWEKLPFFYAVYGFTSCVGLILIAKLLRFIVRRKEGYYD